MNKTQQYQERIKDSKHYVRMYVDPEYFRKLHESDTPRQQEINVCREFNALANVYIKNHRYSVLLNLGIPEIAADLHYQYRKFLRWAEAKGCTKEVREDLLISGISEFYRSIRQAVNQGAVAFTSADLLKVLPLINKGSTVAVLLYMKARCSRPTSTGGITNLMDKTIAEGLGIESRKTVYRARKLLERHGLLEEIYKNTVNEDGNAVTYSKYRIDI